MLNETCVTSQNQDCATYSSKCTKCISWTAIFVGAFVAVGLGFLLHLLTTGLGLTLFTTSTAGLTTLAVGTFIWLFLASYFSMFLSGYITGTLVRYQLVSKCAGALHGFVSWAVALIIALILASHVGMGAGNASRVVQPLQTVPVVQVVTVDNNGNVTKDAEKSANATGIGLLAVFFIFFVGATGSVMGGYFGVRHGDYCHEKDTHLTK